MTARCLTYEEWHRLPEFMDAVLMEAKPGQSRMCVVEDEHGEIVARWLLYPVLMAESLWIRPDHRHKVSVGRKLWRLVHHAATELGFRRFVSVPMDDGIEAVLHHPSLKAELMPKFMVTFPVQELT